MNEIDRLESLLKMQLDWIRAADSKVPPLFAIQIAMLGALCALAKSYELWAIASAIFVCFAGFFLLASLGFVIYSIIPRTGGPKSSLIFFGGIAERSIENFKESIKKVTDVELADDYGAQIHRNAEIAKEKYWCVKWSFFAMFVSIPFWLFSIYLLFSGLAAAAT